MFASSLWLALLGTGFYYFLEYRDWLDWNVKVIYKVQPGPCRYALEGGGSEDVIHIGGGIILISSGFEFGAKTGKIKSLNLNTSEVVTLNIRNDPNREEFLAGIHGITYWRDPNSGKMYLYTLTHPSKEDRVEVFEMTSPTELTYIRTISDPLFTFMNNLVAVGKDKFYITKFWQSRDTYMEYAEMMLRMKTGGVLYYDGKKARQVVGDLEMPNGINISPDGKTVYVAEFNTKKLLGYSRDNTNNLHKSWEVYANTMLDNIDVDSSTGDLYIASHPIAYKITDSVLNFFGFAFPSQVLRFKMRDNMVSEIEEMYSDDGSELVASTAATYANGKLVIGTVRDQLMVCDVNYLSE
ncbi:serum paraoxonase/arylesterase 1-like [Ruditapes philippinarum]|uniref:serum paraoxonase/arylesterase 1-like n=1 Tax=Ruditapes philippinarum TaxID=129788 RepID=UPI00295AA801|nr:serum paraoxonase/arylesterase 1-like [Ruditapes philippinarum]